MVTHRRGGYTYICRYTRTQTHTHINALASAGLIFQTESGCDARDIWVYNRISAQSSAWPWVDPQEVLVQ